MDGPSKRHIRLGPFRGLDERGLQDNHVVSCLNVDFTEWGFTRRPGRMTFNGPAGGTSYVEAIMPYAFGGQRKVLVAHVPEPYDGSPLGFALLDENTMDWSDTVALKAGVTAPLWQSGYLISWVQYNGFVLFSVPDGRIMVFDGIEISELGALQGVDAASGLQGANSYLAAPPLTDHLAVWRQKLVSIKGDRVGLSSFDGDAFVPVGAPVGGPNVWNSRHYFQLLTDFEDEILGSSVRLDRLELYTRRGVFVVDESEGEPFPRLVEGTQGCIAKGSVQDLGQVSMYLSQGRILAFDGNSSIDMSEGLQTTLGYVNWTQAHVARSAHMKYRAEYWLWLPYAGTNKASILLVYNYRKKFWRVAAGGVLSDPSAQVWDPHCATVLTDDAIQDQTLLTGSVAGSVLGAITVECLGEDDDGQVFPAYVATSFLGDGATQFYWADTRLQAQADGALIDLYTLTNGEDPQNYLEGTPDSQIQASPASEFNTPWPVENTESSFSIFRAPLAERGPEQRLVISLPGERDGAEEPAPGMVRWVEISARARESRTP